jgi:hypothetical protein
MASPGFTCDGVAEGHSPRFTISTGNGLDQVLAALITISQPVLPTDNSELTEQGHGTAADRISAFAMGFIRDPAACAAIDMADLMNRRGDLPMSWQDNATGQPQTKKVAIDKRMISMLMEALTKVFSPKQAPALSIDPGNCPGAEADSPASYCPATDTVRRRPTGLAEDGCTRQQR